MLFDFLLNVYFVFLLLRTLENFLGLKRYSFYNEYVIKATAPLLKWFDKTGKGTGLYFSLLFIFVLKCLFFLMGKGKLLPLDLFFSGIVFQADHAVIRDCFFKAFLTLSIFIFRVEFFLMVCFLILENSLYGGFIGFLQSLAKPIIFLKKKIFRKSSEIVDFYALGLLFVLMAGILYSVVHFNPDRIVLVSKSMIVSKSTFIHLFISLIAIAVKDLSVFIWFIIIKVLSSWLGNGYSSSLLYFVVEVSTAILKPFYRFNLQIGLIDLTPMVVLFGFYFLQNVLFQLLYSLYLAF